MPAHRHDPATITATLEARTWAQRRAARTGQPVTDEDLTAYVAKHYPDLKGQHLGYVLTYAQPIARSWPGGPT